jgi:hypothetical protein
MDNFTKYLNRLKKEAAESHERRKKIVDFVKKHGDPTEKPDNVLEKAAMLLAEAQNKADTTGYKDELNKLKEALWSIGQKSMSRISEKKALELKLLGGFNDNTDYSEEIKRVSPELLELEHKERVVECSRRDSDTVYRKHIDENKAKIDELWSKLLSLFYEKNENDPPESFPEFTPRYSDDIGFKVDHQSEQINRNQILEAILYSFSESDNCSDEYLQGLGIDSLPKAISTLGGEEAKLILQILVLLSE